MSTDGRSIPAEPHYKVVVEELLRRHRHEMRPGRLYSVEIAHDPWCPALRKRPGVCCCNPVGMLIEIGGGG